MKTRDELFSREPEGDQLPVVERSPDRSTKHEPSGTVRRPFHNSRERSFHNGGLFNSATPRVTVKKFVLITILLAGCSNQRPTSSASDFSPLPLPDFALTERSGRTIQKSDLLGKVWVACFVFTRCNGPCPSVSSTIARLQHELRDLPDFRLVTITVDPDRDQLKDLNDYANNRQADPERWLFLTGPKADIDRLMKEGFHVGIERGVGDKGEANIDHSPRLVLVDKKGQVRGYFKGFLDPEMPDGEKQYEEGLNHLREQVAELLREKP